MSLYVPRFAEPMMKEIELCHRYQQRFSLAELTAWVDCDYATGHRTLNYLERAAMVKVMNRRKPGHALIILPATKD